MMKTQVEEKIVIIPLGCGIGVDAAHQHLGNFQDPLVSQRVCKLKILPLFWEVAIQEHASSWPSSQELHWPSRCSDLTGLSPDINRTL